MEITVNENPSQQARERVEKGAIRRALERIAFRAPRVSGCSLRVVEYGPTETDGWSGTNLHDDNLYLEEWRPRDGPFGKLRRPQRRILLTCPGLFYNPHKREQELRYTVHDSSILDVAKEEMLRCAGELTASIVSLSKDF